MDGKAKPKPTCRGTKVVPKENFFKKYKICEPNRTFTL